MASVATREQRVIRPAGWFAEVGPAAREEIRFLHRLDPMRSLDALGAASAWAALCAVVVTQPLGGFRWLLAAAAGVLLHGMGVLMHDAVHGSLFRRPALDRLAGFLLGAPTLVSFTAYKTSHRLHHRFLGTDLDPDDFFCPRRPRWLNLAVFYAWPVLNVPLVILQAASIAFRRGTWRDRIGCALEYGAMAAGAVVLVRWAVPRGHGARLRDLWVGMAITITVLNGLRGWTEHALTRYGDPLTETRTVLVHPVVSAALFHVNYHLDHHVFPGVPWYRLPRLHEVLAEVERRHGAFIGASYLRGAWTAIRGGLSQPPPPPAALPPGETRSE